MRYELSDHEWAAIKPMLPNKPRGVPRINLSVADVGTLLDAVTAIAEPVRLDFLWRPVLNDPDDDMVLETAVNGRSDAIVTEKYFAERAGRANIPKALDILKRAGVGNPPMKGDKLRRGRRRA